MGYRQCGLGHPGERFQRLPRGTRTRCMLGNHPRKIPLHPVWHLSVRRAVAAGTGGAAVHRPVLSLQPPRLMAARTGLSLDRSARADQRADVGWHTRLVVRLAGPLGWFAGDADPGDLWSGLRLPARHPCRTRPALKTAGDPLAQRVELIRGVPLVSLLFMASVMFPLFMPNGFNIDKLLRAQVAII